MRSEDAPREPRGTLGPYTLLTRWNAPRADTSASEEAPGTAGAAESRAPGDLEAAVSARADVHVASAGGRRFIVKHYAAGVALDVPTLRKLQRSSADSIRHVNLAPVEDFGVDEDGRAWTASTWLRGDPLRRALDALANDAPGAPSLSPLALGTGGERHPAYIARLVEFFREVAEGLEVASSAGLVHANLSPSNLVFAPTGRLVVTDFGAPIDPEQASALPYRAPEILLETPLVSPRTDVYSLGAILYECLTLRTPFAKDPSESVDARGQFQRIRAGKLVRPRSLREEIPHALEECILCALSVDPGDRYSSPGRLAEDLARFLRGESPAAARSLGVRLELESVGRANWRRPGRWVAALFLVGLLGIAFHLGGDVRSLAERQEIEKRVLTAWNLGQPGEAMAHADRLIGLDPNDPSARALRKLLEESLAAERRAAERLENAESRIVAASAREAEAQVAFSTLAEAAASLDEGDTLSAIDRLRVARERLPDPRVESLELELRRRLEIEPLERDLADERPAVRVGALEELARSISSGDRSPDEARRAASALASTVELERLAALRVYRSSSTEALLTDLRDAARDETASADGERALLSTRELEALFETLHAIGDDEARGLFASWPFARIRAIDTAAPGEIFDLAGGLAVRAGPAASSTTPSLADREQVRLARAWMDAVSRLDGELLLDAAEEIYPDRSLARDLARALGRIDGPRADEWLERLARTRVLEAGLDSVDALASRHESTPLLSLIESGPRLPELLRAHAQERLGERYHDERSGREFLVRTVVSSPEPRLREISIRALAEFPSSLDETVGAREAIRVAVDEPDLRPFALTWLRGLHPDLRRRVALDLLGHRDPSLRDTSVELLGQETDPATVLALVAGLGDRSSTVRRAALEALSRRPHSELFSRFTQEFARALALESHDATPPRGTRAGSDTSSSDTSSSDTSNPGTRNAAEDLLRGLERFRDRVRSAEE